MTSRKRAADAAAAAGHGGPRQVDWQWRTDILVRVLSAEERTQGNT